MENNIILSIKNICKSFGGTQALDNVSLELNKGEIHALLGENGAGKSTLVKIISGVLSKDSGEIIFEGTLLNVKNPQQARTAGINVVYQELSLVPSLSVAENICASNERMNTFKIMKLSNLGDEVLNILSMFKIDLYMPVKNLGIGAQQIVEIAGAISRNCKLLIFDEPTATLTNYEIKELYKIMRVLKGNGVTIIYITHKLSEIFNVADRATVLKDGKYIATLNIADVDEKKIVELMLGRDLAEMYPLKSKRQREVVLEVSDYSGDGFQKISFKIHRGEILGFAGLAGAGRTELFTTIFGVQKPDSTEIYLFSEKLNVRKVKDAMQAGIGYLPEDRRQAGVFMQMNIKENTIAATIDDVSSTGIINKDKVFNNTVEMIHKLDIKINSIDDEMFSLSGGNQQKVVLARWLLASPKILIVDEPTRGIDVGAKFEIYQLLRKMANQGTAIVIISSELPEIFGMSDRVIAMYKGSIFAEVDCKDPEVEQKIGSGIMGITYTPMREEPIQ